MGRRDQQTGAAAMASILAAGGSFIASCTGHPGWGMVLALLSIPLGLFGLVMSASPRVKGGAMSLAAIVLGVIGLVFSVLGTIGVVLF